MAENTKLEQVAIRLVEQPPLYSREPMDNPRAVVRAMKEFLAQMDRELFCIVNMNSNLTPINMNIVSVGALNQSLVHPREVFKAAILSNAAGILLVHNHPSGSLSPSAEDIAVTDRLQKAGILLGITVFDHVIVGKEADFFSFKEHRVIQDRNPKYTNRLEEIHFHDKQAAEKGFYSLQPEESRVKEPEYSATIPLPYAEKNMDSIMKSLETGLKELFTSQRYQEYLRTISHFHSYSFNNTLLIAMQRPDATLVTGYRNWQKMGRQVRRGEKGITIIAPAPRKLMTTQKMLDQNGQPVLDEKGEPKTEEVETTIPYFKAITVFDISQTVGNPLQLLTPEELQGPVKDYDLIMQAVIAISPVPIRFDEIQGEAKGYYHNRDKGIVIQKGMSESQTLKTSIHESGHARLHDRNRMWESGEIKDRMTQEVEAESVAFCVCSAFGLDTSDYSFPYIAGWSSGRDMKELRESMDVIRKTAGAFIEQLGEKIRELQANRENERGKTQEKQAEDPVFFVTECADYPVMGEYHDNLSIEDALRLYEKMPSERFPGGKGIGLCLKEESGEPGQYILFKEGKLLTDPIPQHAQDILQTSIAMALEKLEKYGQDREKTASISADRPIRIYREGRELSSDQKDVRAGFMSDRLNGKPEKEKLTVPRQEQNKKAQKKGGPELG